MASFSGRFSPAQREMYEALLEVQVDCIELCTKHHSLDDVHRQMLLWIGKKIRSLGMVPRNCSLSDASAVSVLPISLLCCPSACTATHRTGGRLPPLLCFCLIPWSMWEREWCLFRCWLASLYLYFNCCVCAYIYIYTSQ